MGNLISSLDFKDMSPRRGGGPNSSEAFVSVTKKVGSDAYISLKLKEALGLVDGDGLAVATSGEDVYLVRHFDGAPVHVYGSSVQVGRQAFSEALCEEFDIMRVEGRVRLYAAEPPSDGVVKLARSK